MKLKGINRDHNSLQKKMSDDVHFEKRKKLSTCSLRFLFYCFVTKFYSSTRKSRVSLTSKVHLDQWAQKNCNAFSETITQSMGHSVSQGVNKPVNRSDEVDKSKKIFGSRAPSPSRKALVLESLVQVRALFPEYVASFGSASALIHIWQGEACFTICSRLLCAPTRVLCGWFRPNPVSYRIR